MIIVDVPQSAIQVRKVHSKGASKHKSPDEAGLGVETIGQESGLVRWMSVRQ